MRICCQSCPFRKQTSMDLFDSRGRLIPADGERVHARTDREYFALNQPRVDYAAIHAEVSTFLKPSGLEPGMSPGRFQEACERLRCDTLANEATRHLFHGVHVPFLLPARSEESDLGKELDKVLLEAASGAFTTKFPQFEFRHYLQGQLEGRLSVVRGVRYERLLEARRRGPVAGWYFPNCMAGFAIPDQRALIGRLPEPLILSGPLEAACAFIGVPELLTNNDKYPNLLALAAVRPSQDHLFCFFEAYGWNLTFNQRSMVGAISEYHAGGLTLIG